MRQKLFFISCLLSVGLGSLPSLAQESLDSLIQTARNKSETLRALTKDIESLQAEIIARDVVLSGQLTFQADNYNNNQDAVTFARKTRDRFFNLTYDQPFSTGTLLSMTAGDDRARYDNFGIRNTANWEVKLTQSLWRDAFGRQTRLRREGDYAELLNRKAALLYEQQLILIDVESLYWELVFSLKEEQIRIKNIEVSKQLQGWTNQRIKRSAADKSDVLQADALMSSRELDLTAVRNQIQALRNRMRQIFPNQEMGDFMPNLQALTQERELSQLLAEHGNLEIPKRLDSISTEQMAKQAEAQALKTREQWKPQFDAYISYGQNGISDTFNNAWTRAGNNRYSGTHVGVVLKIPLNRHLTSEQEKAAELAAEARRLQAQGQSRSSHISWEELQRQILILKKQVQEAQRLSDFQNSKVKEERRLFRLGRSTVFQLVTFEVDAAEAEVRTYRFLTDLRKAESQARVFTSDVEGV